MTQEELRTLIQKNKAATVGLCFAALAFVTDIFYLRPSREARKKAALAASQPAGTVTAEAVPTGDPAASGMSQTPVAPPELVINLGQIPRLNEKVESRFTVKTDYPYVLRRNVFYVAKRETPILEPTPVLVEETPVTPTTRPDITYHGFYNVGPDKIAIMRLSQRLMLTRVGHRLAESPFVLELILGDRVLIRDLEHADGQFEVNLAEATPTKTEPGALLTGASPQSR